MQGIMHLLDLETHSFYLTTSLGEGIFPGIFTKVPLGEYRE